VIDNPVQHHLREALVPVLESIVQAKRNLITAKRKIAEMQP
jgi:hypothetical protein